jgi:osmotically-inducible protein OsmY
MDTDTQVFQDIVDEFKNCPALHYARLNLHVQDGVVTVAGRVNSPAERKAVERVIKRVAGIRTLILEIRAAAIPITVTDPIVAQSRENSEDWSRHWSARVT